LGVNRSTPCFVVSGDPAGGLTVDDDHPKLFQSGIAAFVLTGPQRPGRGEGKRRKTSRKESSYHRAPSRVTQNSAEPLAEQVHDNGETAAVSQIMRCAWSGRPATDRWA
jgi:hypothetical protein